MVGHLLPPLVPIFSLVPRLASGIFFLRLLPSMIRIVFPDQTLFCGPTKRPPFSPILYHPLLSPLLPFSPPLPIPPVRALLKLELSALHPLACCQPGHTVRLAARLLFHLTFVCVGSSLSSCVRSCNSRWFFPVLFSCISIFSLAGPAWAYCPARPLSPPFLNYLLPFPSLISLLLNRLLAVIS